MEATNLDNLNFEYQGIVRLDALANLSSNPLKREPILGEIERKVDTTKDKSAFVFGLRVLSGNGFLPELLDDKVRDYNAKRAQPNYLVEQYYVVGQDGSLVIRKVEPIMYHI